MQEKEHVLKILRETIISLKKEDSLKLKDLSNQTIHTATSTQDPDSIALAVVVYSLSKIVERKNYQKYPGWNKFHDVILQAINDAIISLEKDNFVKFKKDFELIRNTINKLSGKLKDYIQEVFRKASINKASRIYEHGISMEKTANLLGITEWELANYAGQTGISDVNLSKTKSAKERIKLAMEIFK
ncbi:MAG: hypothetical protein AABX88_02035 [Nanoarchaeota archaeon]